MFAMIALKWAALPGRLKAGLAIAVVIAAALLLAYCNGKRDGKAKADLALERANAKAIVIDGKAREAAAVDRQVDAIKNLEAKKELSDAVANLPDTMPSARRIALGCKQLQRSGQNTAAIPACAGHQGGH